MLAQDDAQSRRSRQHRTSALAPSSTLAAGKALDFGGTRLEPDAVERGGGEVLTLSSHIELEPARAGRGPHQQTAAPFLVV